MTHDELLARIDNVTYAHDKGHTIDKDRIVKQLNGLRAVVELHKPHNYIKGITPTEYAGQKAYKNVVSSYCFQCMANDGEGNMVNLTYPCPTIQAIEKELGQ